MARPLVSLAGLFAAAILLAFFYLSVRIEALEAALADKQAPRSRASVAPAPVIPRGDLSELEKSTIALFSARSAMVVHITTIARYTDPFRTRAEVPRGTGSGFVWDAQGHVITNFHVIEGADAARITLPDHSTWQAKLVGASPRNDIAVLRIDAQPDALTPVVLGSSHDLAVGQHVFAIGSPFGLDYTLSTGVISGLGREIEGMMGLPIRGAIQTDAAINPGNSGGPLLDSSGRLIGMNTSILSPSGASAGIGFAVPADTIGRVVPQLIQYGRDVRPTIGVELADDALVRRLGLQGAMIINVLPHSPAERAGLQPTRQDANSGRIVLGDVIVGVDDTPIRANKDLYLTLESHKEGDRVTLHLLRQGKPVDVTVELALNVGGANDAQ
jgi:S1-C subfamily serine protease